MEPNDRIRKNLIGLNNNYFVSKSDPFYWHKIYKIDPNNFEAMYNVGLAKDKDAQSYLNRFKETGLEKNYLLYKSKKNEAYYLVRKSLINGYLKARPDYVRLEGELNLMNNKNQQSASQLRPELKENNTTTVPILLALLILLLISFIWAKDPIASFYNRYFHSSFVNNHAYLLPYQIYETKPSTIPSNYNEEQVIVNSEEKETIANSLLNKIKTNYTQNGNTPQFIKAYSKEGNEVGSAIWPGVGDNINVYVYPFTTEAPDSMLKSDQVIPISYNSSNTDNKPDTPDTEYPLWESTTVLRSALFQYIKTIGHMPDNLNELINPFPNNYLTNIPKEPLSMQRNIAAQNNGDGGWVYNPQPIFDYTLNGLEQIVSNVLKPNINENIDLPFKPIEIVIDKSNNTLYLKSGDKLIRNYPVTLGKNNLTPAGDFYISKKIMNPNKSIPNSIFGTRAMELSNGDYAIHGTNHPETIGSNISAGCIRLKNEDIEDLYAITPLNTPVKIIDSININNLVNDSNSSNKAKNNNDESMLANVYDKDDNKNEEDNSKIYYWNS